MRYIAAYLLLQSGGKDEPSAADIKKVLKAGGIGIDEERLNKFFSEVEGKSISELIAEGTGKLASVPSGGAAVGGAGAGAGASAGAAGGSAPEDGKKEEKVEEKEESDEDMGFGLFD